MPTDVRFNPYAGFTDSDEAAPDVEYVAAQRALLVDLCVMYAAGNTADGDWYVDPTVRANTWLNAIADHACSQEAGQ